MDAKQALAKLQTLEVEGAAELASVLAGKIDELESKNFQVIGEKRNATQRQAALSETLEAVARGLDLQGNVDDWLDQLPGKVQELRRSKDTLQQQYDATAGKLAEVEGQAKTLERKSKLSEIATKAGASLAVLEKLFGDQIDQIAIADDGVKFGNKPLKEYVETDETLKAFAPALFPGETPQEKPKTPSLPSGSPDGEAIQSNPVSSYISNTYGGIKALTKTP